MRILLLLAAMGVLWGQTTVYMRVGSPDGFRVTGATNATPVVLTTSSAHNLSVGDTIVVTNICGTTSANGIRKVKATPTTTSLSITDLSDVDIVGNGAWCTGGNAPAGYPVGGFQGGGKVTAYTLTDHPRVWFDGPTGQLTRWISLGTHNGLTSVVASSNSCTLTTTFDYDLHDGDKIAVWNSSSSPLNGTAFTVTRGLNGTSYTFTCSGVSDGTYSTSGMRVSAFAVPGSPPWDALVVITNSLASDYTKYYRPYNNQVSHWYGAAIRWFVDPSQTTQRDIAKYFITHYEDHAGRGNFFCDESIQNCGQGDTDYNSYFNVPAAVIYTIIRGELTSGERQVFANKVLNDRDDSCTPHNRTLVSKAISGSGTTLTGTGTQWLTDADPTKRLAAGDAVWYNDGITTIDVGYATPTNPIRVYSVESDTSLTMDVAWNSTSSSYYYTKKWATGDCGDIWFQKHHPASIVGHPIVDIPGGGTDGGNYGIGHSNTGLTKSNGQLALMTALADDDARARLHLSYVWNYAYDEQLPFILGWHTGGASQSGTNYGNGRVIWMSENLIENIRNSFVGFPSLPATDPYSVRHGTWAMFHYLPNSGNGTSGNAWGLCYGMGCIEYTFDSPQSIPTPAMNKAKTSNEVRYFKDWLVNRWQIGATSAIRQLYIHNWMQHYNPTVQALDYTVQPTQYLFRSTGRATASALGGMSALTPSWAGFSSWISRTGWTSSSDSLVWHYALDYKADHNSYQAGTYRLYKRGYFIANDMTVPGIVYGDGDANVWNTDNVFDIGNTRNQRTGEWAGYPSSTVDANITRWAKTDPTGDSNSKYVYSLTELKDTFAISVTRAQRSLIHFKKSGSEEILIQYDDVALPSGNIIHGQIHNYLNRTGEVSGFSQAGGGANTIVLASGASAVDNFYNGRIISVFPNNWGSAVITGYVGATRTATVTPNWQEIPGNNVWYTIGTPSYTVTCPGAGGCASFGTNKTILSQSSTDTMISKYIDPTGGNTRMYLDNTNGLYPFGRGFSFRASYCASNSGSACDSRTAMEAIVVHRLVAGTSDTSLIATSFAPSSSWTGVQTVDKVAILKRGGDTATSVPGTSLTLTNGVVYQVVVAGLTAPATYEVRKGGVGIGGCTNLSTISGDTSIYCEITGDGAASSYSVAQTGSVQPAPVSGQVQFGGRVKW